MTGTSFRAGAIDASAITMSGLCLVHCLALPLMAALLPLAGVAAEAEWLHKVFVAVAIPLSGFAVLRGATGRGRAGFVILATSGLALLVSAAFVEALHDIETPLTVSGALLLVGAHVRRWRSRNCNCPRGAPGRVTRPGAGSPRLRE